MERDDQRIRTGNFILAAGCGAVKILHRSK
jgi:hypothetical protein